MSGDRRTVNAPVTLVNGPEAFLAERAVRTVTEGARRADPEADVSELAGGELNPGLLVEHTSPSLFATHRVLVVRGVADVDDATGDALVAMAGEDLGDARLVLVHPGGVKNRKLLDRLRRAGLREVACEKLKKAEDQVDFVRREVALAGGTIDAPAARMLVEAVGGDLRTLASAAAQLVSDATDGRVEESVVGTYFEGHAEIKGWSVAEHAVQGRTAVAVEQLRWALETGTDAVLVTGSLGSSLRTLALLGGLGPGARDADVARELGVPPWKVRSLRAQLRGWSPDGLSRAVQAVGRADLAVKGASNDPVLALTRAVIEVGAARGS